MTGLRPPAADLVVDTSAIVAVLEDESTAARVTKALRSSDAPIMSAATRLELSIVAGARADDQRSGADAALGILDAAGVVTVPVDRALADLGFDAWVHFGKGNHRARLNYGDCFSYSLALHWQLPLLCVGDDFRHTDLEIIDVG